MTDAENDPRILLTYGRAETEHSEVDTYSVAEIDGLRAEVERLRRVEEAGKALLIQSQLKEDRSNWEEWYEVCVPEWEALRAALSELEAKP